MYLQLGKYKVDWIYQDIVDGEEVASKYMCKLIKQKLTIYHVVNYYWPVFGQIAIASDCCAKQDQNDPKYFIRIKMCTNYMFIL